MLRPSADLVGFGWLGFGFFVGGTSCVRGILLGIFTKSGCVLGKGVGIRAWGVTLPDRLGGSPIKFGSLVNRTVLGGFLRCHGGEGPTGLLSFCVLVDLKVKVQATVGLAAGSCIPLPPAVFLGSLTFLAFVGSSNHHMAPLEVDLVVAHWDQMSLSEQQGHDPYGRSPGRWEPSTAMASRQTLC